MDRMIKYSFQILGLVLFSVVFIVIAFYARGWMRQAQFNNDAGSVVDILRNNDIYATRTRELIDNEIVKKFGQNPPPIHVYRYGGAWMVYHQESGLCFCSKQPDLQVFDDWKQKNDFLFWDSVYTSVR